MCKYSLKHATIALIIRSILHVHVHDVYTTLWKQNWYKERTFTKNAMLDIKKKNLKAKNVSKKWRPLHIKLKHNSICKLWLSTLQFLFLFIE